MNYEDINDYELLDYIAENNDDAHTAIFEKYRPLIYDRATKLYKYCRNYGVTLDDLVQEGMIGLNDAINNFDSSYENIFYTYALRCINSRIISYIVKLGRRRHKTLNESILVDFDDKMNNFEMKLVDNSSDPERLLINKENESEIMAVIDSVLNSREKEIINLKINGFSYKEIADIVGESVKRVDNIISRAKLKIREALNKKV